MSGIRHSKGQSALLAELVSAGPASVIHLSNCASQRTSQECGRHKALTQANKPSHQDKKITQQAHPIQTVNGVAVENHDLLTYSCIALTYLSQWVII